MFKVSCQNYLLRLLVNARGLIEPMRPRILNEAGEYFSPAYIHRDTVIIKSGDTTSSSLLFIVKGQVKLVTNTYQLVTLGPGEWFGGEALLQEPCYYSAIALSDCVALSLSEHALKRMQTDQPLLAMSMKRLLMGQSMSALMAILDGLIADYDPNAVSTFPLLMRRRSLCCALSSKLSVKAAGKHWLRQEPIWRQRFI